MLCAEGLHQVADPIFCHYGVVKEKLGVCIDLVLDLKCVRHQWVPVVQCAELRCDAILILEPLTKEELGVKGKLQVIATQVLNVVFNYDFDSLT